MHLRTRAINRLCSINFGMNLEDCSEGFEAIDFETIPRAFAFQESNTTLTFVCVAARLRPRQSHSFPNQFRKTVVLEQMVVHQTRPGFYLAA